MRLRVTGTKQLSRVSDALVGAAEAKKVLRVLRKGIRDEMDPITREQKQGLAAHLPHRGGLAATVASEGTTRVTTALSGRSVGVTLIDSWKGHDMKAIEAGEIRHPTFQRRLSLFSSNPLAGGSLVGRRMGEWHSQRVQAEILSTPVRKHERGIRRNIITGLDKLAAELAKET